MSYILEALKKAQAERQLGSAPTIHAPAASAAPVAGASRKPLVIGFAAGAVLVAAALLVWRQQGAPAVPVAASAPVTPAASGAVGEAPVRAATPGQAAVLVAGSQASTPAAPVAGGRASAPAASATGAPLAGGQASAPAVPASVTPVAATPAPSTAPGQTASVGAGSRVALVGKPDPVTKPVAQEPVAPARPPVPAPAPVQVASAAAHPAAAPSAPVPAAPAPAEETLPSLGTLPEAIRVGIPKVGFGGYMYSPNPADRLILIDNVLRREGEEVAPGLVLEKLLPKGAVMNYRGTRYRVPF